MHVVSESLSESCLSFSSCSLFHSPCFGKNILLLPLCLKASSPKQCHELCVDRSQSRGRVWLSQHTPGQEQQALLQLPFCFRMPRQEYNDFLTIFVCSVFNLNNKNVNALIDRELAGFTYTCSPTMNSKFEI